MLKIAGVIFAVIAIGHLLRLLFSLEAVIGSFMVPKYLSVLALFIFGILSILSFKASRP